MIRIVTRTHLAHLTEQADDAHARVREVQGLADAAYGSHIREVFALTARAEDAEKGAENASRNFRLIAIALEDTAAKLAKARAELADMAERVQELSAPAEGAFMVLLLHYGEPHSIHPDQAAAYAYAATLGAPLSGWRLADERPAAAVPWRCVPFIYDAGRDYFRSVTAPSIEPSEGAA
ncbi:hypothetical protein [Streptomyces sp. NPDC101393]|uniref:hypothetical protein n=1 Tax=Streptomyces sp. NPDC101393 TaxID=3366141 RepID=UPI0037F126E5